MGFFKNYRVYILTAVAYSGSLLFGFDTGVMGSVLALESFKNDFGLAGSDGFADAANAQVSSNVVSLLTAGCFFGAIGASFLNDYLGRRYSLMILSVVFLIGAAIQVGASHEIGMIYGGRVVAGLGIGGMSSITPVFVGESAPPAVRGRIAGMFQEFLVIGSTFAYWLDYGVALHIAPSTKQWRIPVAVQLIPGGLMLIGLFFLKESPRWLTSKGRHEEALQSLAYIRNEPASSEVVQTEIAEIRASIEEEQAATEGLTYKEFLQKSNRNRFLFAVVLMLCQQFSGTNSIGYYAPQIFQTIGLSATNSSLFATGVYGTVKVVATAIFLFVGIDRWGRKKSLIGGSIWMASMMFIIGAVLATHPPDTSASGVSQASIAMVVMIYLYVIGYSASWGPTPWVYLSEIFPTRLRAYGVGLGASSQWLFSFVVTEFTPHAVHNLGWRTFLMFGIFCAANGVFIVFFAKETKGRSLEEMDILFGAVDENERRAAVEHTLNKGVVSHIERTEEDKV
ncbi:general substrate transporter [Aspergillus pseudonomiae]|uniref:General substrate transporter n=1 Tax=Aspergillus pseudonomiae TaxID=1506151 RepID=A0A5N7DAI8_9EURO|nr:general substrate transporter [Aspergillus pseudonomiae]KAB8258765.1 general substrate transporter [Aspergillus pseudonomiae]KAE8403401.1 general substrate transporter [Aspergillus pseudonomiae]